MELSACYFFILAAGIGIMLIATASQHRRHVSRTAARLCRACGQAHPSFAEYCRQCGKKL